MKRFSNRFIISFLLIFITLSFSSVQEGGAINLESDKSLYYEEKYFRFLANNYDNIEQGDFWTFFRDERGIGFKATKDFGNALILKDWSIYNFKLVKIVFRPFCSVQFENENICNAEMWLYHTKDNGYYPPGRRIHIKQNYFVLIIPFKIVDNNHPSIDSLFYFLQLEAFKSNFLGENKFLQISPKKPVKLYQFIQNQPAYMFESKLDTGEDCLYMVFSQYHFISDEDYQNLYKICDGLGFKNYPDLKLDTNTYYYRNWKNPEEMRPKATLMSFNSSFYLKNILFNFLIIALAF